MSETAHPYCPSLEAYLDWVLAGPWEWSVRDCCQFAARWVEARTGRVVLDAPGRSYRTPREALALVRAHGGMLPMVQHYWARVGLPRTAAPDHGDVALARVPRGPLSLTGEALVIRCATRWVGLGVDGIGTLETEPYACWRVE